MGFFSSVEFGDGQAAADLNGGDDQQRVDAVIEVKKRLTVE